MSDPNWTITRRRLLQASAGVAATAGLPLPLMAATGTRDFQLDIAPAEVQLASAPFPATRVWACNGQVPGPVLRITQGETMQVDVHNALPQPTTIHWHGLRIPNDMDGVPVLTQRPIGPGESFRYRFTPPDAGTYWYHAHVNTAEQIGRGVYGVLIVDEQRPISVDRDEVWVLDDWRLDVKAQIVDDFANQRDFARAGRLGNTITVNGHVPGPFKVRAGERIRMRLVNAANARIFSLRFSGHQPTVIARDGNPVEPHFPQGGAVTLAPGQRVDLVLDMLDMPGAQTEVIDTYHPQAPYRLREIVYDRGAPIREEASEALLHLPSNRLPRPRLEQADLHVMNLHGGDLGNLDNASMRGQMAGLAQLVMMGKMWAINGVVGSSMSMPPQFDVRRGQTVLVEFSNHSVWPHPMHLHGHAFEVVEHSGDNSQIGLVLDTVLLGAGETARVAFVADNPGDWLLHCHILGHAEAGMITVFRVS